MAQWRESGQTSEEFASGRDFSAGGLRCAAATKSVGGRTAPAVAVAKVVRASATVRAKAVAGTTVSFAPATGTRSPEGDVVVVLEVGGARLGVRRGCDAATLAAVFEAMFQRGGAR